MGKPEEVFQSISEVTDERMDEREKEREGARDRKRSVVKWR